MEKLCIVMPAYNEEANIKEVVRQWYHVAKGVAAAGGTAELIVANDGSTDSTGRRLEALQHDMPLLSIIDKANSGHGPTLHMLYREAISRGADYIFQTDSDGQTDPAEFSGMWEKRHDHDIQIGLRRGREDGIGRHLVSSTLRLVAWLTFGVNLPDANAPFRLMRASAISPMLDIIPSDFFLTNVAVAAIGVKRGVSCRWMPVSFRQRTRGVSSINLRRIAGIGIKAIRDFRSINRRLSV